MFKYANTEDKLMELCEKCGHTTYRSYHPEHNKILVNCAGCGMYEISMNYRKIGIYGV